MTEFVQGCHLSISLYGWRDEIGGCLQISESFEIYAIVSFGSLAVDLCFEAPDDVVVKKDRRGNDRRLFKHPACVITARFAIRRLARHHFIVGCFLLVLYYPRLFL